MSADAPRVEGGADTQCARIAWATSLGVWCRVAALSFGGPAGQIAVMHRILVEERRWIGEQRFLHALNYCMLLPGPEAQQLATYIGWLMHGWRGGLLAGLLFIAPGFLAILALSLLYTAGGDLAVVQAIFYGLKPAVVAIVLAALLRIGSRALRDRALFVVAVVAFLAIGLFSVPFPLVVLGAALLGLVGSRVAPQRFRPPQAHASGGGPQDGLFDGAADAVRPSWRRSIGVAALWCGIWFTPIVALIIALGWDDVYTRLALFFSQAAVVTFGGAYAVLAYIAQEAVQTYGWLRPGEMLDGLGMAESTPGPLIQVVQFVGYLAAYRHASGIDPYLAAILASILVTWVTFAPCFLWIFLGAPYVERLRGNRPMGAALAAITAAVVGVIANLALWFALHASFAAVTTWRTGPLELPSPEWSTLDPATPIIACLAFLCLRILRLGMLAVLGSSVVVGACWKLLG